MGDYVEASYDTIVGGLFFNSADSVLALIAQAVALQQRFDFRGNLTWERVQARTIEYCRTLLSLVFEEDILLSCVSSQSAFAPSQGCCRWWYGLYRTALVPCLDKGTGCDLRVDPSFEEHLCGGAPCKRGFIADSPCPAGKKGVFSYREAVLHLCDLNKVIAHGLPLGVRVDVGFVDRNIQEHIMGLLDVLLGAVGYAACAAEGNVAKLELAQVVMSKAEHVKIIYDRPDAYKKTVSAPTMVGSDDEVVLYDPDAPPLNSRI